jgi:diguanylate cyclase (GGDEF)-like protein
MEETLKPFFNMHDRNNKDGIVAIMSDIDHFKKINDSYGHSTGDKVLKQVASAMIGCIRTSDLAIRYGGEEFVVFLIGQSTRHGVFVAEKIRGEVSQMKFDGVTNGHKITLSCGVASRRPKEPFADFIQRADTALYQAKSTSRDTVCCEDAPS